MAPEIYGSDKRRRTKEVKMTKYGQQFGDSRSRRSAPKPFGCKSRKREPSFRMLVAWNW